MKEVEDAAQGSQIYHPVEYIDTKRFEHEAFLAEVVGKPAGGKHIAIIGEPGAGKTTILTKIGAWLIQQAEQQPPAPLVVAWISLADVGDNSLEKYIKKKWLKKVCEDNFDAAWEDWKKLRQQWRVWLLLDGLDEMSGDALAAIHRDLGQAWAQNLRVVMTCRLNQWETAAGGNILTNSFDVYRTLDYSYQTSQGEDQVKEFISKWFADDEKVATQIRTELDAPGKERIKDLVKNPLRLTLLCASWEKDNQALPEMQADLYRGFVNYLYKWKAAEFSDEVKLRQELDLALRELAKAGLNRQPINDGAVRRFRFTASEISELWKDLPDTLLPAAKNLGWLNVVGEESGEAVYAFYHPTFQEYFAACSIDDWDYFLPRAHIDRPVPCQGEDIPTYRAFEQEWRQVILFWMGHKNEIITDTLKEEFIKRLTDFQGREGKFYFYRAYIMAAIVVGEFKSSQQAESIVGQIIEFAFGRFNSEKNQWEGYLESIESLARATIPFTHRKYAIKSLEVLLEQNNSNNNKLYEIREILNNITSFHEKIVEEDIREPSDSIYYERPGSRSDESINQKTEDAITILQKSSDCNPFNPDKLHWAIDTLARSTGNQKTIKALITFLGQGNHRSSFYRPGTIAGTDTYGYQAALALGKVAVGNKLAIIDLIDLLKNDKVNHNICFNVYIAIYKIVTKSEMFLVIENIKGYIIQGSYKSNPHRFNKCYMIVFQYTQFLTYPEFYKAWHQRQDSASLNLKFFKDD
jgi:predicted NACHT family NTPase